MELNQTALRAAYAAVPADLRDMNSIAAAVRAYVDAQATWASDYIDRLNQLLETHGCPAGSDRLSWLDAQLSDLSTQEKPMPTVTASRPASVDEIADEMDRRGAVIEALEAERDRYLEALRDIDAVGVDFGHFEASARTMQERARKALFEQSRSSAPTRP